jgi:hypothetical protein
MISMFMRVIGAIYILPAVRVKFVYFICTLLQVGFYSLIVLGHYSPQYSVVLFLVGMIGQGIGRVVSLCLIYWLTIQSMGGKISFKSTSGVVCFLQALPGLSS